LLLISTEVKTGNLTMAPIRVGFIGLSSSGWAKGAHFPFLKESDKYEIVAICNSSVESAKEAIKSYELPSTTKAYGNPEGKSPSFSSRM
jgi:predicted dehydrogenase